MKKNNYFYLLISFLFFTSLLKAKDPTLGSKVLLKNNSEIFNNIISLFSYENFYIILFSSLLVLFLNNLVFYFYLRSKSYLLYLGVIVFWILSFFFWEVDSVSHLSKIGFSYSIIISSGLYLFYIKGLVDLKEKSMRLKNLLKYFTTIFGLLFPISYFYSEYFIYIPFVCFTLICFYLYFLYYEKKDFNNSKILIYSYSFPVISLLAASFSGSNVIFVGFTIHFLILGIAPFNKIKSGLKKEIQKEKDLSNLLEDVRLGLEKSIEKRTKEVKELLDNMKSAVFTIGKDFRVLYPVSRKSEEIFGKDIIGLSVYDFLFYNLRKGTKSYSDLTSCLTMVFDQDEIQFFALSDGLPNKIRLPSIDNKKSVTLSLSYSPILNEESLVQKILCIAEDVSDSEQYYIKNSDSMVNFGVLKEVGNVESQKKLATGLRVSIEKAFLILEDFVSPLSDTYKHKYFEEKLMVFVSSTKENLNESPSLINLFKKRCWELVDIEERKIKVDAQIEATNIICDILDALLEYQDTASLFFKIDFKIHFKSVDLIMEKIKGLDTLFKNLFEYAFLVRDIESINDQKIGKVLHLAKLYPDFERSIDLIHQRSRLIYFLFKGIGDNEIALLFANLSNQVKLMPEREKLTESIIKNSLIEPYKNILGKKDLIEKRFLEVKIQLEESNSIDKKRYFSLLLKVFKRLLDENGNKLGSNFKALPQLDPFMLSYIKNLVATLSPFEILEEDENQNFDEINMNLEKFFEKIFIVELEKEFALPVDKKNVRFIKFLKSLIPSAFVDKKKF